MNNGSVAVHAKDVELQRFVENYDLLVSHGVGASLIRTRIFNELEFPKVKISDDHRASCISHARLMSLDDLIDVNRKLVGKLKRFFVNHQKLVQLYDVEKIKLAKIEASIYGELSKQGDTGMVSHFPHLPAHAGNIPDFLHPLEVIDIKDGVKAMLVASRRDYYKVFNLSKADIKDGVLDDVEDIQNVSAKGMVSEVAIDVLVLDYNNERLELRLSKVKGISNKYVSKFMNKLASYARRHLSGKLGEPYDYLHMILPLYFSNDDNGLVSRLDFLDDAGIERVEKSRRDKKDIRTAPYHEGGATKIDFVFQGFGIRKVWTFESSFSKYKLSLDILGSANMLRKGNQTIDQVFLLDCFTDADYNFLLNKVIPS